MLRVIWFQFMQGKFKDWCFYVHFFWGAGAKYGSTIYVGRNSVVGGNRHSFVSYGMSIPKPWRAGWTRTKDEVPYVRSH